MILDYIVSYRITSHDIISADPGLSQGRGGAWDHRRCGTLCPATSSQNFPNLSLSLAAASTSQASHCTVF